MKNTTVTLTTNQASRLIKRLCKHFSHKVEVEFDETSGHVDFPFGAGAMKATDGELTFSIQAEDQESLEKAQHVISDHTEQFSRDETFEWNWR